MAEGFFGRGTLGQECVGWGHTVVTDGYIICEGPTEVRFIKNVLAPSFGSRKVFLHPVTIGSQRSRGGNVTFDRLYRNVRRQLYNNRQSYCSTLIDYYGLDLDFPGLATASTIPNLDSKASAVADSLVAALRGTINEDSLLRLFLTCRCTSLRRSCLAIRQSLQMR